MDKGVLVRSPKRKFYQDKKEVEIIGLIEGAFFNVCEQL
jgi:hypothetical protein